MKGKKIKDLAAKKGFRIGAVAVLVALFAIVGIVRISGKEAAASSTAILSAKAAKGSISTTVSGSGNLQAADTVDVSVPTHWPP